MMFIKNLVHFRVLLYSRYENDPTNPDFITGNDFARVGVVQNPQTPSGSLLTQSRASALVA
jgi:hypothetical protein